MSNGSKVKLCCPACTGEYTKSIFTLFRRGSPEPLLLCQNCGLVFQDPRTVHSYEDDYYFTEYRREKDLRVEPKLKIEDSVRKQKLEKSKAIYQRIEPFIHSVIEPRRGVKVLDIGCAKGWLLDVFKQNGFSTFGCEPDIVDAEYAQTKGHHIKQGLFRAKLFSEDKFDIITITNVLEHVPNLMIFFDDIRKCSSGDGLLFVNVPCLDFLPLHQGSASLFSVGHVNFFAREVLEALLQRQGFEVMQTFDDANWNKIYRKGHKAYIAVLARNSSREVKVRWDPKCIGRTKHIFRNYYRSQSTRNKIYIKIPQSYRLRTSIKTMLVQRTH